MERNEAIQVPGDTYVDDGDEVITLRLPTRC